MKSSSHFTVFEYGHLVSEEGDARINNAVVLPADLFKWLELRCLKDDADNTHRLLTLSSRNGVKTLGNDSNLLIVFYVQIMPDDFVMQLHRF